MPKRRRLFVAIDLDEATRHAMAVTQADLSRVLSDREGLLRMVKPEDLHLTLVFLGEVEDAQAAAVIDAMAENVSVWPYSIEFGGFGRFPPVGPPRILWIGLASGARETIDVHRLVTDRLAGLGRAGDARPYHPHVTLARWRRSPSSHGRRSMRASSSRASRSSRAWDARPILESMPAPALVAPLAVDHVRLYESCLSSAGPAYTCLARARLQPTPDTLGR